MWDKLNESVIERKSLALTPSPTRNFTSATGMQNQSLPCNDFEENSLKIHAALPLPTLFLPLSFIYELATRIGAVYAV